MTRAVRIGSNRGRPRLWLEGQWLADLGFKRDEPFLLRVGDGRGGQTLAITIELGIAERVQPRKVSGKGDRPIIDIAGAILAPFVGKSLQLRGSEGRIVIKEVR